MVQDIIIIIIGGLGAGGYLTQYVTVTPGTNLTIKVGSGYFDGYCDGKDGAIMIAYGGDI